MEATGVPASLAQAIAAVSEPDAFWAAKAAQRQRRLTMPPGSLGRLLELGQLLAALQRTDRPSARPALLAVCAADHGIAEAGVSAYPQDVTGQMVANFLRKGAAVNVLGSVVGAAVRVVDMGVARIPEGCEHHPDLVARSIRRGTSSFLDGPAMTRAEACRAVETGIALADDWMGRDGFRVLGLGEMGIGNSTTAAALAAALTGAPVEAVVGLGTGLDAGGLAKKRMVVQQALDLHAAPGRTLWGWLERLGGFEILGLAGLAIGAARHRALVLVDGFISSVAALVAACLCPPARLAMVAAHLGTEPGHRVVLDHLGLKPLLQLDLRLGEATGAALAIPLITAAAGILTDMATFDEAGVSEGG